VHKKGKSIALPFFRSFYNLLLPASLRYPFGEEEFSVADTFRQLAPIGFVYLMFISLIQSVQYLISNTIEEKSNRIIKVLLASVTSDELLMRKILGIALSGLTTIAAWLLSFFLFITLYQSSQTELVSQILNLSSALN